MKQQGDAYDDMNISSRKIYRLTTNHRFFLSNTGGGYTTLPTVSVTSSTEQNGVVKAYGENIGKVVKVRTNTVKNMKQRYTTNINFL